MEIKKPKLELIIRAKSLSAKISDLPKKAHDYFREGFENDLTSPQRRTFSDSMGSPQYGCVAQVLSEDGAFINYGVAYQGLDNKDFESLAYSSPTFWESWKLKGKIPYNYDIFQTKRFDCALSVALNSLELSLQQFHSFGNTFNSERYVLCLGKEEEGIIGTHLGRLFDIETLAGNKHSPSHCSPMSRFFPSKRL